ncbi:MAG: serine hydrolase [Bacteroidota bacterium]
MRTVFSLLTFLLLHSFNGQAQDLQSKIEEYMNAQLANNAFSGVILIAKGNEVLYQQGYGHALAKYNIKNNVDTRFRLGSITKQFTAMAIMQYVEQGKIDLQDKITNYLPDYPKVQGDKITIHHLLTHTSGIPSYTGDPEVMKNRASIVEAPDEFIKRFNEKELEFEPGAEFSYNNSGYYLLGMILEKVGGKPYDQVLADNIFKPLGMENSGYEHYQNVIPYLSQGYSVIGDDPLRCNFINTDIAYAAGALYSTVGDLHRWHLALSNNELVSAETKAKIYTPEKANYGYGWEIDQMHNRTSYAHGGGIDGFSTFIARFPEEDVCVVALSNYENAQCGNICRAITAMHFGEAYEVPEILKSIELKEGVFEQYAGAYNIFPDFDIKIFAEKGRYFAQATGQDAFEIHPESPTMFYTKVVNAKLEFIKGDSGQYDQIILHQNGQHKGKRLAAAVGNE